MLKVYVCLLCLFLFDEFYTYSVVQRFGISNIFNVFLKTFLMLIKAAFIWSKNAEKNSNTVKYYSNLR